MGRSNDVLDSLQRALHRDMWIGLNPNQYGIPFTWARNHDGSSHSLFEGQSGVLPFWGYYSPLFDTAGEVEHPEYKTVKNTLEQLFRDFIDSVYPFEPVRSAIDEHVAGNALSRAQDFNFIRENCSDLPASGALHIDVGPGLGGAAAYSLFGLRAKYFALEASDISYSVQRLFYKFLAQQLPQFSPRGGRHADAGTLYVDVVEMEKFEISEERMRQEVYAEKYALAHVPSWRFPLLRSGSLDLMTATFMLNEVSYAGIVWIIYHTLRCLKPGGYLYFRDSNLLYPHCHDVSYDELVQQYGCRLVKKSPFKNMNGFHGIQRCYQKMDNFTVDDYPSFCKTVLRNKMTATVQAHDI